MFVLVKTYWKQKLMTQLVTRLQSSDSKEDLEDDAQQDYSEMDGFVEHLLIWVLFVPDADVERITVQRK